MLPDDGSHHAGVEGPEDADGGADVGEARLHGVQTDQQPYCVEHDAQDHHVHDHVHPRTGHLGVGSREEEPRRDDAQQQLRPPLRGHEGVDDVNGERGTVQVQLSHLHLHRPVNAHAHEVDDDGVRQGRRDGRGLESNKKIKGSRKISL